MALNFPQGCTFIFPSLRRLVHALLPSVFPSSHLSRRHCNYLGHFTRRRRALLKQKDVCFSRIPSREIDTLRIRESPQLFSNLMWTHQLRTQNQSWYEQNFDNFDRHSFQFATSIRIIQRPDTANIDTCSFQLRDWVMQLWQQTPLPS